MAQFLNMYSVDLQKPTGPQPLRQMVCAGDNAANRIGAIVTSDGGTVSLGGSCVGKVVRADGTTVQLSGTISGNQAYVVLDQASCAIAGQIQVAVCWVSGSNVTTLVIAYGSVVSTQTGSPVQPSTPIPDLTQLLAEIENMRTATAAANAAATGALANFAGAFSETAVYTAGQYVTYTNGKFYRLTADHAANVTWANTSKVAVTTGGELSGLKQAIATENANITELKNDLNNVTSFKAIKGIVRSGMASTPDGYIHPYANSYCVELPVERDKTYIILIKGSHNRDAVYGINDRASGSPATLIVGSTTGLNMTSYSRAIMLSDLQYQYIVINLLYNSSLTDVNVDIFSYANPNSYLLNGKTLATQTRLNAFDGVYRAKSVSNGEVVRDDLMQSAVIPVIQNTLYRLEANGDFNRFIVYGASSYTNGSSADKIYSLGRNKQKNVTKVVNSNTYNFLIVSLNYNSDSAFSFRAEQVLGSGGTLLGVDYVQKCQFDDFYERVFPTEYHASFDTALVDTYSDVLSLYDTLKNAYPNYITKNALNNDNTIIYEYVLTTGAYNNVVGTRPSDSPTPKPKVLITSGVHGYEKSAVMSTYVFAKALCEDYGLRKLREQLEIHIVPVAVPFTYDNDSRQNANGVNINRNFDSPNWTSETTGDENNPGPYGGSEYETQALQNWMNSNTDAAIYIDHHNSAYTNECCWLGANSALEPSVYQPFKKAFWNGIKPLYPYWLNYRNINPSENIYAYTGTSTTTGSATSYAVYKGIPGFAFETSWEQNNANKHGRYTIAVGAEAFTNMMLGIFAYLNGES